MYAQTFYIQQFNALGVHNVPVSKVVAFIGRIWLKGTVSAPRLFADFCYIIDGAVIPSNLLS